MLALNMEIIELKRGATDADKKIKQLTSSAKTQEEILTIKINDLSYALEVEKEKTQDHTDKMKELTDILSTKDDQIKANADKIKQLVNENRNKHEKVLTLSKELQELKEQEDIRTKEHQTKLLNMGQTTIQLSEALMREKQRSAATKDAPTPPAVARVPGTSTGVKQEDESKVMLTDKAMDV